MSNDGTYKNSDSDDFYCRARDKAIEAIEELRKHGLIFVQKSPYHFKLDDINFYPGKGTVTLDPGVRIGRGVEAILDLMERRKFRI